MATIDIDNKNNYIPLPNETELYRFLNKCEDTTTTIKIEKCMFLKKKQNNNNSLPIPLSTSKIKNKRINDRFKFNNKLYNPKFLFLRWYHGFTDINLISTLYCKKNKLCINPHHIYIDNENVLGNSTKDKKIIGMKKIDYHHHTNGNEDKEKMLIEILPDNNNKKIQKEQYIDNNNNVIEEEQQEEETQPKKILCLLDFF